MERKLVHKHHVEPFEVRQGVVCVEGLPAWRKYDRQRGLRWIVPIEIRSKGMQLYVRRTEDHDAIRDLLDG